jgi:hypothetical protein
MEAGYSPIRKSEGNETASLACAAGR